MHPVRDSGILHFACEILRFRILDSAELWNHWLFGVGKRERTLLLAKAKSSKSFYFCFCVDSGDLCFACEILRVCGICGGFCGFVESMGWILRNRGIWRGICEILWNYGI